MRNGAKPNGNPSQTPLENIDEPTSDEDVTYADMVPNKDNVDESSFSSNQPQQDIFYTEFAPTQPPIYANTS